MHCSPVLNLFLPCFKTIKGSSLIEVCIPRAACFTAEHCLTLEAFSLAILLAGEEATVLLASCSTAAVPLFRVFLTAVGFSEEPFVWLSKEPVRWFSEEPFVWFSEEPVVDPRRKPLQAGISQRTEEAGIRTTTATECDSYRVTWLLTSKGHSSCHSAALSRRVH